MYYAPFLPLIAEDAEHLVIINRMAESESGEIKPSLKLYNICLTLIQYNIAA